MLKFLERIYDGLVSSPFNSVGALIIFLIALPLIRSGLREKPPPPEPTRGIEIESPWFVQNFLQMQTDVARIKDQLGVLSSQVAGIAKLLRSRQGRKPKK